MKKIIVTRDVEKFNNFVDYKIMLPDGKSVSLRNGKSTTIEVDTLPAKLYAQLNFLKSNELLIDSDTTLIKVKGEIFKARASRFLAPVCIILSIIPRLISDERYLSSIISSIGLAFVLTSVVYAFVLKRREWVFIEKA